MAGTIPNEQFFKKVYPILLDIAFENSKTVRSYTAPALTRPLSLFALLARLPKNLDIVEFFLKLLKLLGQAPFCFDAKRSKYFFAWSSLDVVMSLAVASMTLFGWFIFISHMAFKKFTVFGPG